MEAECARMGKPGSGLFMMNFFRALFVDAVDIMCGKYSKRSDCMGPKITQIMDQMVRRRQNITSLPAADRFPFKSPVLPVLTILDRMDGKVNIDE
jgi:hypothetical protein